MIYWGARSMVSASSVLPSIVTTLHKDILVEGVDYVVWRLYRAIPIRHRLIASWLQRPQFVLISDHPQSCVIHPTPRIFGTFNTFGIFAAPRIPTRTTLSHVAPARSLLVR